MHHPFTEQLSFASVCLCLNTQSSHRQSWYLCMCTAEEACSSKQRGQRLPGAGQTQLRCPGATAKPDMCWHQLYVRMLVAERQLRQKLQSVLLKAWQQQARGDSPQPIKRNNKWQSRKARSLANHARMHLANSGCAKRYSPEEQCLLIITYWINWFPICSAVSKTSALSILPKGAKYGDYQGCSSGHFSQSKKLFYTFQWIRSVSIYIELMKNVSKISNPSSLKKQNLSTHVLTSDTALAYCRKRSGRCCPKAIHRPFACGNPSAPFTHLLLHSLR